MRASTLAWRVALGATDLIGDRLLGRHRPYIVNHLVTVRCNLKCPFCYVSGPEQKQYNDEHQPRAAELSTDETRIFYRQLVAAGFKIAIVLGGEPLLRADLGEMLEELRGRMFVTVFTNGMLLADRAELLGAANNVFVSLDAPDEQHDSLRGCPGSFRRALEGIEVLRRKHPGVRPAINMTLTGGNVHRVGEMLAFAKSLGLPIGFQPPSFEGQFTVDDRPFVASAHHAAAQADVAAAFRIIRDAASRGERVIGSRAFFDLVIEDRARYRCHYPRYALGPVLPNGDVVGCTASRVIGNVRRQSVADIVGSTHFMNNGDAGLACDMGCRDWGLYDLSAVYNGRFRPNDALRYARAFVAPPA